MSEKYTTERPDWVPEDADAKFTTSVMGGIEGIRRFLVRLPSSRATAASTSNAPSASSSVCCRGRATHCASASQAFRAQASPR